MRGHFVLILMGLAMVAGAHAQVNSTAPSNMQVDSLAPLPQAVSASVPARVSASDVVSASAATDPFTVTGVTVVLSDTTGFARDAALEKAARQAMPQVLEALPMDKAKAAKTVKSLGSAMTFVGSYRVVKETIVPTYSLTVDLTFDQAMLHKNFGGVVAPVAAASTVTVSGSVADVSGADVPAPVMYHWILKVAQSDPGVLDKLMLDLNGTPGTHAVYRLLTSAGAEMLVDTPLDEQALIAKAGEGAQVTPVGGRVPLAPFSPGEVW